MVNEMLSPDEASKDVGFPALSPIIEVLQWAGAGRHAFAHHQTMKMRLWETAREKSGRNDGADGHHHRH